MQALGNSKKEERRREIQEIIDVLQKMIEEERNVLKLKEETGTRQVLTSTEKVKSLIYSLRNETSFPMSTDFAAGSVPRQIIEMGDLALPDLLVAIDDNGFTRSGIVIPGKGWYVVRTGDFVIAILQSITGEVFSERSLHFWDEGTPQIARIVAEKARIWWKINGKKLTRGRSLQKS